MRSAILPQAKKSGSARRGPADPLAFVECIRLVLALGGWGARKPSSPQTDSTGALSPYDPPLRHALDDKLAKLRHLVKKILSRVKQQIVGTNK
jgi:hypothetical protein